MLLRVLGDFDMEIIPDLSVREARPGDRWLLCSDGLSGVVSHDTIASALRDVADVGECAERLVELALRGGAPDNVTVVVGDVVELDALPDGAAPGTASHVVGAAALDRHRPTRGGRGAAARAAEHSAAARAKAHPPTAATTPAFVEEEDLEDEPSRLRRVVTAVVVLLVLASAVVAGWLGYRWTQTQYYVGVADEHVAIYRGIPQTLGPLTLSEVVETTRVRVDDLPAYIRDRLDDTLPADDLADARASVESLEQEARR